MHKNEHKFDKNTTVMDVVKKSWYEWKYDILNDLPFQLTHRVGLCHDIAIFIFIIIIPIPFPATDHISVQIIVFVIRNRLSFTPWHLLIIFLLNAGFQFDKTQKGFWGFGVLGLTGHTVAGRSWNWIRVLLIGYWGCFPIRSWPNEGLSQDLPYLSKKVSFTVSSL